MSKRITLSVRDELYGKMQKWKDSLNFSGIFQEAISSRIKKKEEYENFKQKTKEDIDMNKVIEKLRKQKEGAYKDYFEKGKKHGFEYAQSMDYVDFQYALQYETTNMVMSKDYVIDYNPFYNEDESELKAHMREEFEKDRLMDWVDPDARNVIPNEYFCEWEEGFIEGIQEFWNEIKDKL